MAQEKIKFTLLPVPVKIAVAMQVATWIYFISVNAAYYGTISLLHLTMGMLCCVLCYSLKKWGRILCMAYDVLMIALNLYSFYTEYGTEKAGQWPSAIYISTALLFLASVYMLSRRDVSSAYQHESVR